MNPLPVSVPHPSEFIREEMAERGWTDADLAVAMGGSPTDLLAWQVYKIVGPTKTTWRLGRLADDFARAFGTSRELFANMESSWLAWKAAQVPR